MFEGLVVSAALATPPQRSARQRIRADHGRNSFFIVPLNYADARGCEVRKFPKIVGVALSDRLPGGIRCPSGAYDDFSNCFRNQPGLLVVMPSTPAFINSRALAGSSTVQM